MGIFIELVWLSVGVCHSEIREQCRNDPDKGSCRGENMRGKKEAAVVQPRRSYRTAECNT